MKMKKITVAVVILAMAIGLFNVAYASTDKYDLDIYVGEIEDLDPFLVEEGRIARTSDVTWKSSNQTIVSVNSYGQITGKQEGKGVIYAHIKDGDDNSTAVITVNVVSMVKDFDILEEEMTVGVGAEEEILYEILAIDGFDDPYEEGVVWTSSNAGIAKVDQEGVVEGKKEGKTVISAYTVDGKQRDSVVVEVVQGVTGLKINDGESKIDMKVGEDYQLSVNVDGEDINENNLKWKSTDESILKVDRDGIVTAVGEGYAKVKASTKNEEKFDYITVNVMSMVKDIELDEEEITLDTLGQCVYVEATLIPMKEGVEPLETDIKWTSSNSKIATVDGKGKVTARGYGTAKITATTKDSGRTAHVTVHVTDKGDESKRITIKNLELVDFPEEAFIGEMVPILYTYEPEDATTMKMTFDVKYGGKQIKKVDGEYYFVPTYEGVNFFTIESENGKTDEKKILIQSALQSVTIDEENLAIKSGEATMYVGQALDLDTILKAKPGFDEGDIYQTDVKWTSSDTKVAKFEDNSSEGILVGVTEGKILVSVTTVDGNKSDVLRVKVLPAVSGIGMDDMALPTGEATQLEPEWIMKEGLLYDLDEDDLDLEVRYTVLGEYVTEDYIQREIEYEQNVIAEIEKDKSNTSSSSDLYKELLNHKERLRTLEKLESSVKQGYAEVKDSYDFKDRYGKTFHVAKVKKGAITGFYPGKVVLKVEDRGETVKKTITVSFEGSPADLIIYDSTGNAIATSGEDTYDLLDELFGDLSDEEKAAMLFKIDERFGDEALEDVPSNDYVLYVLKAEELDIVPESMKESYGSLVSRVQFTEMAVSAFEQMIGETLPDVPYGYYLDTENPSVSKAYSIGLVSFSEDKKFHPERAVTKDEAIEMLDNVIKAYEIYTKSDYEGARPELGSSEKAGQPLTVEEGIARAVRLF